MGPVIAGLAGIAGRVTGTKPPAVFLTLGRHKRLFWGWLHFAGRLMPGGRLARREVELVILRVASLLGSDYELTQHRRLGRRAGLSRDEIAAAEGISASPLSEREHLALRVAQEMVEHQDVSDVLWAELERMFDERERIELVLLVGHYAMLATVLKAFRVQPDAPRG